MQQRRPSAAKNKLISFLKSLYFGVSLVAQIVKTSPANAGDLGSIPGSERSPGEGNGYSLRYSCLENYVDRGAWWATVQRVEKSQTRLSDFHTLGRVLGLCSRSVNWGSSTRAGKQCCLSAVVQLEPEGLGSSPR